MESSGCSGGGGGGGGEESRPPLAIEMPVETLHKSEIFHIVKEIIGFVLYMHHQIPSILKQLEDDFDALKEEYKSLEEDIAALSESRSSQRKHNLRKREVKQGIKRWEKLMSMVSNLLSALQLALDEMPSIQGVTVILGGSLVRPKHVYHVDFPPQGSGSETAGRCTRSKVADTLARKAIRALLSAGAGSSSYTGPSKTFLLVRSSPTFSLPMHFLPKRDLQFSKKTVPLKLLLKPKIPEQQGHDSSHDLQSANSTCSLVSTLNDVIWFQCKHIIKGLPCKTSIEC